MDSETVWTCLFNTLKQEKLTSTGINILSETYGVDKDLPIETLSKTLPSVTAEKLLTDFLLDPRLHNVNSNDTFDIGKRFVRCVEAKSATTAAKKRLPSLVSLLVNTLDTWERTRIRVEQGLVDFRAETEEERLELLEQMRTAEQENEIKNAIESVIKSALEDIVGEEQMEEAMNAYEIETIDEAKFQVSLKSDFLSSPEAAEFLGVPEDEYEELMDDDDEAWLIIEDVKNAFERKINAKFASRRRKLGYWIKPTFDYEEGDQYYIINLQVTKWGSKGGKSGKS